MSLSFDPKREGLIIVPTRLLGPKENTLVRLALDTGAMDSMINAGMLHLVGYDIASSQGERVQLTTGSGVEYVPRIILKEIQALGLTRQNYTILCHTLPPSATVDGVLGLDFFRGYKLTVDFRKGFVRVE